MSNYEPRLVEKKRKNVFMKIVVTVSLLIPFLYTVVSVYFAWYEKYLPAELTIAVFGFFGSELFAAAWVTRKEYENGGMT
jgi:hypothetical protein